MTNNRIEELINKINSNNNDLQAHFELGELYMDNKFYDLAIQEFNEVIRINPEHTGVYLKTSELYYCLGEYDLALEELKELIYLDPNNLKHYWQFANYYIEKQLTFTTFEKLLKDLNEIKITFNETSIHFVIGEAYYEKGLYSRAIGEFKEGLEKEPNNFGALVRLGSIFLMEKNFTSAIEAFQMAIMINPNFFNIYIVVGYIFYILGSYDESIDILDKVLKYSKESDYIKIFIANSYFKKEDYTIALEYFNKAVESEDNNTLYKARIALIHHLLGKNKDAQEILLQINSQDPTFIEKSKLKTIITNLKIV